MSGSISLIVFQDIAKSLKISFGFNFVSFRAIGSKFWEIRFPVYTFPTKTAHAFIFIRSQVLVYRSFADERTDRWTLAKKFCFCFLIKNIYTCICPMSRAGSRKLRRRRIYLFLTFLILGYKNRLVSKISVSYLSVSNSKM